MTEAPTEAQPEDRRLTNSEMQTARDCLRKHQLAYGLSLRKRDPAQYFRFGDGLHVGLDVRAKGTIDDAIVASLAAYDKNAPGTMAESYDKYRLQRTSLVTLLNGYHWRWGQMDEECEVVASELSFDVPIINPETNRPSRTFTLAGKIDKIVKLPDGRLAVMEHKTTADDIGPDSDYWKRLRIDSQISIYFIAARALGYEIDTVLYDVVRKPTIGLARLTQAQTRELADEHVYRIKRDGESVEAGRVNTFDRGLVDAANCLESVFVDGEQAEVIPGKKGYAIRETYGLYAMRLNADLAHRPEHYFQRREIPRVQVDLDEARFEVWEEAKRIRFHEQRGIWPRNTRACVGIGKCPYFDLCTTGFDPLSDSVPEGFCRPETNHTELEAD